MIEGVRDVRHSIVYRPQVSRGLLMCVFFSVEMVLEAFCELADLRSLSAQASTTFHFKFNE